MRLTRWIACVLGWWRWDHWICVERVRFHLWCLRLIFWHAHAWHTWHWGHIHWIHGIHMIHRVALRHLHVMLLGIHWIWIVALPIGGVRGGHHVGRSHVAHLLVKKVRIFHKPSTIKFVIIKWVSYFLINLFE